MDVSDSSKGGVSSVLSKLRSSNDLEAFLGVYESSVKGLYLATKSHQSKVRGSLNFLWCESWSRGLYSAAPEPWVVIHDRARVVAMEFLVLVYDRVLSRSPSLLAPFLDAVDLEDLLYTYVPMEYYAWENGPSSRDVDWYSGWHEKHLPRDRLVGLDLCGPGSEPPLSSSVVSLYVMGEENNARLGHRGFGYWYRDFLSPKRHPSKSAVVPMEE